MLRSVASRLLRAAPLSRVSLAKQQSRSVMTFFRQNADLSPKEDDTPVEIDLKKVWKAVEESGLNDEQLTVDNFFALVDKNPELKSSISRIRAYRNEVWDKIQPRYPPVFKDPVRVAVTGASGQIGYALLFRLLSGEFLGVNQPIILQLLELTNALPSLEGVAMELRDCAFPLLQDIVLTDKPGEAFKNVDYAFLVGAKPRSKGMERSDLLKGNASIFQIQGRALNDNVGTDDKKNNLKVVVVGNPANTNALIASHNAPSINPRCFSAMTRLDHNRGLAQLSLKTGVPVTKIERFCIWGNHSSTQYPDITNTLIDGKLAREVINDDSWVAKTFIPTVQQRGAAIIQARGSSSAASAASSALDHVRDWKRGTFGHWTSMAVKSNGEYGTTPGNFFSFPVVCEGGDYKIVQNVPITDFSAQRIAATDKELNEEKAACAEYLK